MRTLPPITPFAVLPTAGKLIEGWLFSDEEMERNPAISRKHRATDWEPAGDLRVRAVADGFATASYRFHANYPVKGIFGESDGVGWGRFVQIFHPQISAVTLYAHLDEVGTGIPWINPIADNDGSWTPPNFGQKPEQLASPQATLVQRGDIIGQVGNSGLRGAAEHWLSPIGAKLLPSWDRKHLHLECYHLGPSGRWVPVDPFNLYGEIKDYFTEDGRFNLGSSHLWLLDSIGQPLHSS